MKFCTRLQQICTHPLLICAIVSLREGLARRATRNRTPKKLRLRSNEHAAKSIEKNDTQCVKNATKNKIDLRDHLLEGLFLYVPNSAYLEFVALSHKFKNELKLNPLKSRLIRGFLACLGGFEPLAFGVGDSLLAYRKLS